MGSNPLSGSLFCALKDQPQTQQAKHASGRAINGAPGAQIDQAGDPGGQCRRRRPCCLVAATLV
jgi:hypothetical protein